MNQRITLLLFVPLTLAACTSDPPIDLGKQTEANGSSLSAYAGDWRGYVEAYKFEDGTDSLRLTLDAQGSGALVVGEREPTPVTDLSSNYVPYTVHGSELIAGFAYPIHDAGLSDMRIRMETGTIERYRDWCSHLSPRAYSKYVLPPFAGVGGVVWAEGGGGTGGVHGTYETDYSCTELQDKWIHRHADGTCEEQPRRGDLPVVAVPCGTWGCQEFCECTAERCSAREAANTPVRIDAVLRDDRLEGTLVLSESRFQVRLTRQ